MQKIKLARKSDQRFYSAGIKLKYQIMNFRRPLI